MGTINFEVAALCILLLNFFLFFSRSRLYLQQTRVFLILLLGTTFATVADIITVVMYWNVYRYSTGLLYAANILYYIFQNSVPLVFFIFLLALSGKTGAKRRFAIFLTGFPWMASLSLILTTPVTGWVFSFDPDYGYHRGAVLPLLYAIAFDTRCPVLVFLSGTVCGYPGKPALQSFFFCRSHFQRSLFSFSSRNFCFRTWGFLFLR